jgi:hypothetical protein
VAISAETTLELQSFDLAILAAVLVCGAALVTQGNEVSFCTLDGDLLPWDRKGARKPALADLFDSAGVRVYGNFLLMPPDGLFG